MAVFTKLDKDDIKNFLQDYDCGELVHFQGIEQGVENTNYKIETDKGRFILTVFEQRTNRDDLPFFFAYMAHLKKDGIECPVVIDNRIGEIKGKAAVLISFLDGANIAADTITHELCFEMGVLLGRMHLSAQGFDRKRPNSMSVSAWRALYERFQSRAGEISPDLNEVIESELKQAEKTLSAELPSGVVHADAFPDNVFRQDGHISGIIDFYFSATDFFAYDLAITLNAWCFSQGKIVRERAEQMIEGYSSVRPLSEEEKNNFSLLARAAALRILMTRSHDFIFHDPENLVRPKDPLEYKQILEFHIRDKIIS